jgi:fatty acid desaturase
MRAPTDKGRQSDLVILLFLFALFLMLPPFVTWWATAGLGWYVPYLIWGLVILLAAWLQMRGVKHDV